MTKASSKYAQALGKTKEEIQDFEMRRNAFRKKCFPESSYHTNGFEHKKILTINRVDTLELNTFQWGLIPLDVGINSIQKIQNQTINARAETMFEIPSFKEPAFKGRAIDNR